MKILLIGGGIGGLTTAIALKQRGIDYQIFEAAPELKPVGAGIWMAPNALQELERLGLAGAVKTQGWPLQEAHITDQKGRLLSAIDSRPIEARYGHGLCAIHRGRLQQLLLNALDSDRIQLGKRLRSILQTPEMVQVTFEDGTTATGDVLIGADGIHSATRRSLFGELPLRYSGQTCWRGVARLQLPEGQRAQGHEMWGQRAGLRIGFSHIHPEEVYWYVSLATPSANQSLSNDKALLEALVAEFPDTARQVIAAADAASIIRTDLFDLKPIPAWHQGRVVLLGDAAHATTPNLGQGGSQAIEDAWVLADALARFSQPSEAFAHYQQVRMPKAQRIVQTSLQIGRLSNLGGRWATGVRNAVLRLTPRSINERQLDFLYRLNH
ncbi:MAG: FAD-dependent monooxygenase [Saprospiraceae bacterium]|nr:FAD-dependent monooxygenase [Saprospiraceae bacterium]